ncbi:hypothetical protein HDU93_004284 [Gonapodya sp. JEL0774]|nr:hypothetical protein HDU93_004284 [Gonapodya sp. JEL0774]
MPPQDIDRLLKGRFAVINLWRPIVTAIDTPLAIADATTSPRSSIIPSNLVYPHRVGEVASFAYDPTVAWYYTSNQTPEESYLIKTFESDPDKGGFVPHAAFSDPTAPVGAPPRESIEVRVLVCWEEEAKL